MKTLWRARTSWFFALWLAACLLMALQACGGGNWAGVGSGGTGLAEGSISGFGSVIVDGVEYDDSAVSATQADATGSLSLVVLKLGQRVRVGYSGATVQSVQVTPQLIGPVTQVPDRDGWLQVMGQWVRIVKTDDDVSRLGPTATSGYARVDSIALGDDVQVHGAWAYDGSKSAMVLVATLVDKATSVADPVHLGGVVTAWSGNSLRLNATMGTAVQSSALPSGLAVGQVVQVWVARTVLVAALANGTAVQATRVLSDSLSAATLDSLQQLTLSGLATGYDPATRTVQVQGVRVTIDASAKVDVGALARGEFVSLQINTGAGTGTNGNGTGLVASSATVRTASPGLPANGSDADLGGVTELKGSASGIDWTSASVRFTLRGTAIQASSSAIDSSCKRIAATALTSTVYVQVRGKLLAAGDVVSASQVLCSLTIPPGAKP